MSNPIGRYEDAKHNLLLECVQDAIFQLCGEHNVDAPEEDEYDELFTEIMNMFDDDKSTWQDVVNFFISDWGMAS